MTDASVGFDDKRYSRHLFEYRYENAHWSMEIFASSRREAEARLKALAWAQYKGEIVANIPVPGTRLAKGLKTALGALYRRLAGSIGR